jgi:hypothetical protein
MAEQDRYEQDRHVLREHGGGHGEDPDHHPALENEQHSAEGK